MNYWLLKTEPSSWSWSDQLKAKNTTAHWDGVRNAQATAYLKAMKKGDLAFFYHTGDEKQIVGIVEVSREYYPDPSDKTDRAVVVDFRAVEPLKTTVTLAQIKADQRLKQLPLVRQPRLSVSPVDEKSWKIIVGLQ